MTDIKTTQTTEMRYHLNGRYVCKVFKLDDGQKVLGFAQNLTIHKDDMEALMELMGKVFDEITKEG